MNFEVVLFILLVVAGFFWICDRLYFRKLRGKERIDLPFLSILLDFSRLF